MSELEQLLHRRRSETKDEVIAREIGKDASSISRIFSGEAGVRIVDLERYLSALGLRVVDSNDMVITPGELDAVETLAFKYLQSRRGGR